MKISPQPIIKRLNNYKYGDVLIAKINLIDINTKKIIFKKGSLLTLESLYTSQEEGIIAGFYETKYAWYLKSFYSLDEN